MDNINPSETLSNIRNLIWEACESLSPRQRKNRNVSVCVATLKGAGRWLATADQHLRFTLPLGLDDGVIHAHIQRGEQLAKFLRVCSKPPKQQRQLCALYALLTSIAETIEWYAQQLRNGVAA